MVGAEGPLFAPTQRPLLSANRAWSRVNSPHFSGSNPGKSERHAAERLKDNDWI
jgi:hypothetical protein